MHTNITLQKNYYRTDQPDLRSALQPWNTSDYSRNNNAAYQDGRHVPHESTSLHQNIPPRKNENIQAPHIPEKTHVSYHSQEWREGDKVTNHSVPIYAKPMSRSNKVWEHSHSQIIQGNERLSPTREPHNSQLYEENYFPEKTVSIICAAITCGPSY